MVAYDLFVAPMDGREKTIYYNDSKELARLFGVQEKIIPSTVAEFEQYMMQMLNGDAIAVGPAARSLAREVLYARPWIFKAAGPLFRLVTAGLLPEKLRVEYGLSWNDDRAKNFLRLTAAVRAIRPWMPARLRIVPNARRAERSLL
jgi:uncharacterized protein (DUF2236 family)